MAGRGRPAKTAEGITLKPLVSPLVKGVLDQLVENISPHLSSHTMAAQWIKERAMLELGVKTDLEFLAAAKRLGVALDQTHSTEHTHDSP